MSEKKSSGSKQWPGAFGVYSQSREAVMLNIGTILVLILVSIAIEIVFQILFKSKNNYSGLINFLIAPFFTVAFFSGVFKKKVEPGEIVDKTSPFYVQLLLLNVVTSLAIAGSLLLFVIPFFFVMPRLVLAPYYLIDKDLDAMDAFKMSWHKTKDHQGKVWGIIGATLVMALPALTIIGIPLAIYFVFMYSAASVVLYKYVAKA